jgi:hypothetical protein
MSDAGAEATTVTEVDNVAASASIGQPSKWDEWLPLTDEKILELIEVAAAANDAALVAWLLDNNRPDKLLTQVMISWASWNYYNLSFTLLYNLLQPSQRSTALHAAALSGHYDVIPCLLVILKKYGITDNYLESDTVRNLCANDKL